MAEFPPRKQQDVDADSHVWDFLGVGFGPSNLALALAVSEHNADAAPQHAVCGLFLERQQEFGWHRGMLLEDTTMQVSFLKDLVTMRDPRSQYSFLNYLHTRGRLADFINHKQLFPSRVEFHDYLEWAASGMSDYVRYGTEVLTVRPVYTGNAPERVEQFEVLARGPEGMISYRARNLVLAAGMCAHMPNGVTLSERIWHNHDLLHRLDGMAETGDDAPGPRRFAVLGAGQSAAETVQHLHGRFPDSEVHAVFARYGYAPADDSPFVNQIFDPQAVADFHVAPDEVKQRLLDYHRSTNYSVVDLELIEELYRRRYQEQVLGRDRLQIHQASVLRGVRERDAGVELDVEYLPTGQRRQVTVDVLVCATGYRPVDPAALLGELDQYCLRGDGGELAVQRDYRLRTTEEVTGSIFVQGPTEHSHGITSTLLSNTAVRSAEIRDALAGAAVRSQAISAAMP